MDIEEDRHDLQETRSRKQLGLEHSDDARLRPFVSHKCWVEKCCFSPDSSLLATCSGDQTVQIWKIKGGEQNTDAIKTFPHDSMVWCCDFSPDGGSICTCCSSGSVHVWDIGTQSCRHTFTGKSGPVFSCKFGRDANEVFSAGADKVVTLLSFAAGKAEVIRVFRGHTNVIDDVAISPSRDIIASASKDRTVRLWFFRTATYNDSGRIKTRTLRGHTHWVTSCIFSGDGTLLASTSLDRTVRLWHVGKIKIVHVLKGHSCIAWSCSFVSIGQTQILMSCASDKTVRYWDQTTGKEVGCERDIGAEMSSDTHGNQLLTCASSRDNRHIAVGDYEGRVFMGNLQEMFPGVGVDEEVQEAASDKLRKNVQ